MKKCQTCGAESSDDYSHCLACGGAFESEEDGLASQEARRPLSPPGFCAACGTPRTGRACRVCGQPGVEPNQYSPVRYVFVEVMSQCGSCGHPLPLNGPLDVAHCTSCQADEPIAASRWSFLPEVEDEHSGLLPDHKAGFRSMRATGQLTVAYGPAAPACPSCRSPQAVGAIPVGADGPVACPSCGHAWDTFPAPDWLKEVAPTITQIYAAERASQGQPGVEISDAVKPITFPCPECQASLRITAHDDRTVTCTYCDADVFLPDALWKRLHPVKTKQRWFFRGEGEPAPRAERLEQKARERAEEEWREQYRRDCEDMKAEAERADKTNTLGVILILVGVTVAAVLIPIVCTIAG